MSKNNKQSKAVEVEVEQPAEAVAMPVAAPAPVRNSGLIQTGVAQYKVKTVLNVRIVSPKDLPEGAFFVAQVMSFSDSPVTTYKSRLIKFSTTDKVEFFFPCTAVIARSLGMKDGKSDLVGAARDRVEKTWLNRWLLIRSAGRKASTDDKAGIALFDVAEVEAPTA